MAGTKIKICGISTTETLDAVLEARADFVGLNFYPPSPRHVSAEMAARLADRSQSRIKRVGVFVDADDALLAESVTAGRLDAIQLHGAESPQRAAQLRSRLALPVWKVLSVTSAADIERLPAPLISSVGQTIPMSRTSSCSMPRLRRMPPCPAAWVCVSTGPCCRPIAGRCPGDWQVA